MLAAISSNVFCFVELYSLLRAFHSFVPLGTAPFHALTPPSLTSFMLLISHIKADFMDMPRRLILPSAAALLVKCTQPDAVSVSVLCQSMTCFPQEALQLRAHGVQIVNILSAWLWQCEDGAWFTRVFTAALAGCVNRAEEATDALDADSVALLMLLFVSRADAPMDETIALLASVLTVRVAVVMVMRL